MAKAVQLASGKKAGVGTTSRIGKYDYTVQADGSVKRSDGKVTAKPTAVKVEVKAAKAPVAKPAAAATPKKKEMAPVPMPRDARPKAPTVTPFTRGGNAGEKFAKRAPEAIPFTRGGNAGAKIAVAQPMSALGIQLGVKTKPKAKLTEVPVVKKTKR